MDSEIKISALARWDELLPDLLDGPVWRDTEFDLKDSFNVLDDFLFMRALQHRCRVQWANESQNRWNRNVTGWCELAVSTNEGPVCWIYLVRPTVKSPRTVWHALEILMHEMCHALFTFRCHCNCCCCPLNRINGVGLDWHGPSWEQLRRFVERTACLHLSRTDEPFRLCHGTEPQIGAEEKKVAKMLGGLYKKVTQQGRESAELKRIERAKKRTEEAEMLAKIEGELDEEHQRDILACAGAMFDAFEHDRLFLQGARLFGLKVIP